MWDWIYPQFIDETDAKKTARGQAVTAAVICGVVTAVVAVLSGSGNKFFKDLGISAAALLDAFLLLAVAVGVFFMSRTAALVGLIYYLGNQLYMMHMTKRFSFVTIVFTVAFINGESLKGEIENETEDTVVFRIQGGTVNFSKSEIRKIIRPDSGE